MSRNAQRPSFVYEVSPEEQVLIVWLKDKRDLAFARDDHWYRIPVRTAPKQGLYSKTLAFYQPANFGSDGMAIHWWAKVTGRTKVRRCDLFPGEPENSRSESWYYKFTLGRLQRLEPPVLNVEARPVNVFIPTVRAKFFRAKDINDLFHDSPLEDLVWEALKSEHIAAQRQYHVHSDEKRKHVLDFAVKCECGWIAVECDGDTWHAQTDQIPKDNERSNLLESKGWHVLRFNGKQIRDDLPGCLRQVRETINRYGGLVTPDGAHRWYAVDKKDNRQLNLFQNPAADSEPDDK